MNFAQLVTAGSDQISLDRAVSHDPCSRFSLEEMLSVGEATKRVHFQPEPSYRSGQMNGKIGVVSARILAYVRKAKRDVTGPMIYAALPDLHKNKVLMFVCYLAKRKHLVKSGVPGHYRYRMGKEP